MPNLVYIHAQMNIKLVSVMGRTDRARMGILEDLIDFGNQMR